MKEICEVLYKRLALEWDLKENQGKCFEDAILAPQNQWYWKCKHHQHSWKDTLTQRLKGHHCPYCQERKLLSGFNDFATKEPELLKEWHPTKNESINPTQVLSNNSRKVWWQCEKGHEWEAEIKYRVQGRKCPYCQNKKILPGFNDFATKEPELSKEWHPIKNKTIDPTHISKSYRQKVWWLGNCGHEWEASVQSRSNGGGCPICRRQKVLAEENDLQSIYPELAKQWHPTKNGALKPSEVAPKSHKKVWWLGECGHEWEATILNRSTKTGCPYCSGRKRILGVNDLKTAYPTIFREWHPSKNKELNPFEISPRSSKKVWWLGSCGHAWKEAVFIRTDGSTCPFCPTHSH